MRSIKSDRYSLLQEEETIVLHAPNLSHAGDRVAFVGHANNLVSNDVNGHSDVLISDLADGTREIVSRSEQGIQADAYSGASSISGDGRFVVFESRARNLDPSLTNQLGNKIWRKNLQSNEISLASVTAAGDLTQNPSLASVSFDGRFVAFQAKTIRSPGASTRHTDIFVKDFQTNSLDRITPSDVVTNPNANFFEPSIDYAGDLIAFRSDAGNLLGGNPNEFDQIYVLNRHDGSLSLVSSAVDGTPGNNHSSNHVISGNGRFVVFQSRASNLVPNDTNDLADIFVKDLADNSIERVSTDDAGMQLSFGGNAPDVSADGRSRCFPELFATLFEGSINRTNRILEQGFLCCRAT